MTIDDDIGTVEAGRILGCSPARVQQAIRRGTLPARLTPRGYRIRRADVEQFAANRPRRGYPRGRPRTARTP